LTKEHKEKLISQCARLAETAVFYGRTKMLKTAKMPYKFATKISKKHRRNTIKYKKRHFGVQNKGIIFNYIEE